MKDYMEMKLTAQYDEDTHTYTVLVNDEVFMECCDLRRYLELSVGEAMMLIERFNKKGAFKEFCGEDPENFSDL